MVMQICKTVASTAVHQSCELVASSVVYVLQHSCGSRAINTGTNLYKQNGQFCVWRLKKRFSFIVQNSEKRKCSAPLWFFNYLSKLVRAAKCTFLS